MNERLNELVDRDRIEAISATPVPAPSHSQFPGEHLFVNCLYSASVAGGEPSELVASARSDLARIVRVLVEEDLLAGMRSICVSFFGCPMPAGPSQRVYRYSAGSESYPASADAVTSDSLLGAIDCIESSDVNAVTALLT